jgi:uncharacterized protein YgbK (DUF1537 family)
MNETKKFLMGVVADDFTGAGDVASLLSETGLKTLLLTYLVDDINIENYEAVVVALKSRSQETDAAVKVSREAFDWLKDLGAGKLYLKYCSTFDSTPTGNIGPVADMLLEHYNIDYTILCPTMLENGRTVRDGILYVQGVPLAESPMRNHPLNPMWDSYIPELMKPQSKYPCIVFNDSNLQNKEAGLAYIEELKKQYEHFYLVVDYYNREQGKRIANLFDALPLWTGGSGILGAFAELHRGSRKENAEDVSKCFRYGRLMFSGSCSAMTQKQVETWLNSDGMGIKLEPKRLANKSQNIEELSRLAIDVLTNKHDILFYSNGSVGERMHGNTDLDSASIMEKTIAGLAKAVMEKINIERVIVAGGETSGAVMQALEYSAFDIGPSVAPGVPILYPVDAPGRQIVLKSGNFGAEDFFVDTLK